MNQTLGSALRVSRQIVMWLLIALADHGVLDLIR